MPSFGSLNYFFRSILPVRLCDEAQFTLGTAFGSSMRCLLNVQ
jgi:hypothetical protein